MPEPSSKSDYHFQSEAAGFRMEPHILQVDIPTNPGNSACSESTPLHSVSSKTSMSSLGSQTPQLGACLVVGGCGFLGHHVVKRLLNDSTCTSIAVMSRSPFKNRFEGATYHIADITNIDHVRHVLSQVRPQIIIDTASPHAYVDHEHAPDNFKVNVDGVQNLLKGAAEIGTVKAFVYTSSAPIIAGSGGAYDHADETVPTLATIRKGDPYHVAKALGDQLVLEANGKNGILTACIRPTALYGEGDFQLIVPTLRALKDGQTTIWMGYNEAEMDVVYVGHVAESILLAARGLLSNICDPDSPKVQGEAFNITDDQPSPPWTFFRKYWVAAGDKSPLSSTWMLPPWLVMAMTNTAEWFAWFISFGKARPQFLIKERMEFVLLTRTYSIKKARDRLGFKPWVNQPWSSQDEAVIASVNHYLNGDGAGLFEKASQWAETPCPLITETVSGNQPIPKWHYCRKNAQNMAMTHNTIFRAINAIYHHAPNVRPGSDDAADLLSYAAVVYDFLHHHQITEEKIYFPEIEKATKIPKLMADNVLEHAATDAAIEKFKQYAETTCRDAYDAADLMATIEAFAPAYTRHNHAEIRSILALHDKIDSDELKAIDDRVQMISERESDIFKAAPLVFGCQDSNFLLDGEKVHFPLKSSPLVRFIVNHILARRHKNLWRFNPSTIYGIPQKAPEKKLIGRKVGISGDSASWRGYLIILAAFSLLYFYFTMGRKNASVKVERGVNGSMVVGMLG